MRTLLTFRLTVQMERIVGSYLPSKTWYYKKHNKKSPYIPIIFILFRKQTWNFLSAQHILSKSRWRVTCSSSGSSSNNYWVFTRHCPKHFPPATKQVRGGWSTASPPSQTLIPAPICHPPAPIYLQWGSEWPTCQDNTTLCEKKPWVGQSWNRPFCLWVQGI